METPNKANNLSAVQRHAVMIKLVLIGVLALALLIPSGMIQSVIHERELLREGAVGEIHSKWAESQQLAGPILTVPLLFQTDNNGERSIITKYFHLLPKSLDISGEVFPEMLKRGIYEATVYRSDIQISGEMQLSDDFDKENFMGIKEHGVFLTFGLSDLRGIEEEIDFSWNDMHYAVQPGSPVPQIIPKGFHVPLHEFSLEPGKVLPFSINLKIRGSERLSFLPLGQVTSVEIHSPWQSPKFDGSFLPNFRDVSNDGFLAKWKILELNRNFPQYWLQGQQSPDLEESGFGVGFISPMDDYKKSIRSTKYALLVIGLTFLMLFLVEVLGKKTIHPLHYAMVGIALCLFYTLLISISEHSNFGLSYFISSAAVISTVSLYSISLFKSKKHVIILALTLCASFGFIFLTLKSEDYALLMGSVGLFAILATVMYITRNVNWYTVVATDDPDNVPIN